MGFSTGKKLLVTKRNMRSGSGALSTWGTNLSTGTKGKKPFDLATFYFPESPTSLLFTKWPLPWNMWNIRQIQVQTEIMSKATKVMVDLYLSSKTNNTFLSYFKN